MCTVKIPLWQGKNKYEGINTFEGTSLKVNAPPIRKKNRPAIGLHGQIVRKPLKDADA
jgi:hypothetical protein